MALDLVIGIDSSTTATKAIAWNRKGKAIAEGRAAVPLSNPKPGWFEQDVTHWTGALAASLKQLSRKIDMGRVAALSVSNQRESFAQFDAKDRVLRPGTLWLDERARAETRMLSEKLGAETIHRISGKPVDVTPCLYRCAWFAKHEPKVWTRTAMTAEVHGVLVHYLTGQWKTSVASADPMGLVDLEAYDWSETLIAAVGLSRAQLPKLGRPGDVLGEVTAAAARSTGLKAGTPVVAGGGDGQCAGTGANVFAKDRAYINLGTAAVSGSFGKTYATGRAFRTMGAVAEDGYIYESAIRTGTFLVNWTVERLFNASLRQQGTILAALEKEAARAPIGANGITLLPYWSGSMTPHWDSDARGAIVGLSASHGQGDIYRGIMEGIALEQAMMTNQIAEATTPITHFVAIGGGAKSDLWCQILADASGRDVKRLETVEASALGAACAAAKGAGWFTTVPQAAAAMAGKPARTFRPKAAAHRRYQELLALHSELWPLIAEWNARRVAFAAGVLP
jgi:xylulokinase